MILSFLASFVVQPLPFIVCSSASLFFAIVEFFSALVIVVYIVFAVEDSLVGGDV